MPKFETLIVPRGLMLKEVEVDRYKPNVYGLVTSLWIQTLFDNFLLEHGGLPYVLPLAVHRE